MSATTFDQTEREQIRKLYGMPLAELDKASFKKIQRELRAKFHPDNFEHLENEAVKEMATEKFQEIERLSGKIEQYLGGAIPAPRMEQQKEGGDYRHPDAQFAGKRLKIEILTANKDLKYHLFGTQYRWLEFGDKFKIPSTKASIVIDEGHHGRRVGFQESIRMFLTFDEEDSIETMIQWMFSKIQGSVNTLIIDGETVLVEEQEIINAVKRATYLRIGTSSKEE